MCIVLVQKFIWFRNFCHTTGRLHSCVYPGIHDFLGTSSSVLQDPFGLCMCPPLLKIFVLTEWYVSAVLDFTPTAPLPPQPEAVQSYSHRVVGWEGTLEDIQFQPPITHSQTFCEDPCIVLPNKRVVSCWEQPRTFGEQPTAENWRYGDVQKGLLQWIQLLDSSKPRLRSEIFLKLISWAQKKTCWCFPLPVTFLSYSKMGVLKGHLCWQN